MDELAELGIALFIAAIVIYLIILAIPFILGGLALYFLGRKFRRQVKRHYKLTQKTYFALFGIGSGSLLFSGIIVSSLGISPYFALPISVLTFLVVATCMLGIWGYKKLYPFMEEERLLQQQEPDLISKAQGLETDLQQINREVEDIRQKSQGLLEEKNHLDTVIQDLSTSADARLWISLKERWLRAYSDMPDGKIEETRVAIIKDLKKHLQNRNGYSAEKDRELTLKATLLHLIQLERAVRPAEIRKQDGERILRNLTEEHRKAMHTLNSIKTRRTEISQTLASMKTSRIVLD